MSEIPDEIVGYTITGTTTTTSETTYTEATMYVVKVRNPKKLEKRLDEVLMKSCKQGFVPSKFVVDLSWFEVSDERLISGIEVFKFRGIPVVVADFKPKVLALQ